jgi:hypothetical protein
VFSADRCGPRGSPTGSASHSGCIIPTTARSYRYVIYLCYSAKLLRSKNREYGEILGGKVKSH